MIDTKAERAKLAALEGHTPGPWQVLSEDQGIAWGTHWSISPSINIIDEISESVSRGEDATLIAAAPDMKATLTAALDEIDRLRGGFLKIEAAGLGGYLTPDLVASITRDALSGEGET